MNNTIALLHALHGLWIALCALAGGLIGYATPLIVFVWTILDLSK